MEDGSCVPFVVAAAVTRAVGQERSQLRHVVEMFGDGVYMQSVVDRNGGKTNKKMMKF